mmetsp:Transcript_17582/g.50331  ORF Transcript_17582/g.50331 Transcript_17582/m.50331 type:complete len:204 (-) Transcript_17582:72-683(-)
MWAGRPCIANATSDEQGTDTALAMSEIGPGARISLLAATMKDVTDMPNGLAHAEMPLRSENRIESSRGSNASIAPNGAIVHVVRRATAPHGNSENGTERGPGTCRRMQTKDGGAGARVATMTASGVGMTASGLAVAVEATMDDPIVALEAIVEDPTVTTAATVTDPTAMSGAASHLVAADPATEHALTVATARKVKAAKARAT